ncbi:MAG TPA: serine hydrolase domain-containing protein [Dongiaceae bacterium]|nr:serine hydrolase domain-containing protein [Dongiaceae bacterium]
MEIEDVEEDAGSFRALDEIYARYQAAEKIPGLAFGVVRGGELAYGKGLGIVSVDAKAPVGTETFFRIASMTKVVTAIGILLLRDRGLLSLDAPVKSFLSGFGDQRLPTKDSRPITLQDLLTHVGGFVTDDPWGDRQLAMPAADFDRMLVEGQHFARAPRIEFEYSNLGYSILGRVIEKVASETYPAFIQREILRPIGMAHSTFEPAELPAGALAQPYRLAEDRWVLERLERHGAFGAMAGLTTNVVEYARFVAFLLDAWPARDDAESAPVSRALRRELGLLHSAPRAPTVRTHEGRAISTASAYGYGLVNSAEADLGRYLHHRGGLPGYGSHFLFSPETGVGVFSFANRTYAAMNEPNLEAAMALKQAGLWRVPQKPISALLAPAIEAVSRIYRAGKIEEGGALLAENILLDRAAGEWNRLLSTLAKQAGELRRIDTEPNHALSTRLLLICEKGTIRGELILTGELQPHIQALILEAVPAG